MTFLCRIVSLLAKEPKNNFTLIVCILICRRSIHSYKVTETTRKTVTKDKDGNVTEDVSIDKTTTETDSKVQPAGRMARLLKVLPGILMLLILAALAYYVTAVRL